MIIRKSMSLILILTICCIFTEPVLAIDNVKENNVAIIYDLHQTVGTDIIGLVDTNFFDTPGDPIYNIVWSNDGSHMLIRAFIDAYPKGKPQHGGYSALYISNSNGSEIKRIAWSETACNNGGIVISNPAWSESGGYFIYMEQTLGRMRIAESSHIYIVSKKLEIIHKIEFDPESMQLDMNTGLSRYWSPVEEKFAVVASRKVVIYNLNEKTDFSFDLPDDTVHIQDLKWSPDGQKIVFLKGDYNSNDIFIMNLEKKELNQINTAIQPRMSNRAQWSPDSEKIVFSEVTGSESNHNLAINIYFLNISEEEPVKITTLYSGTSGVLQWYPDSERLLIKKYAEGSSKLYSFSISGETKELFTGTEKLDGIIGPNGCVLATLPSYNFPSETENIFLLNNSEELTVRNVTYYRWKGNDLLFITNNKISIMNISTYDTWDMLLPLKSTNRISTDPSGRFIAADNIIVELHEQSEQIHTIARNYTNHTQPEIEAININTDDMLEVGIENKTLELPGFTTIIAFAGILTVMVCIYMKK